MTAQVNPNTAAQIEWVRSERALAERLQTAASILLYEEVLPAVGEDPATEAGGTLEHLVRSVAARPTNDRIWLLLTAVAAAYPSRDQVDQARRQFELMDSTQATIALLQSCLPAARAYGEPDATLEILVECVLVDVDHAAKYELHTGIQRVSRSLLPLWDAQHQIELLAWHSRGGSLRRLSAPESSRVIAWATPRPEPSMIKSDDRERRVPARLIVPWRCVVVMVEVPPVDVLERVACLGDHSGNRLVGIAYDAIPVASADMVPPVESSKFVRYLTSLKFAARVAGISATATAEFAGFARALATQGLRGPVVSEVALASSMPEVNSHPKSEPSLPSVLVVGSHEPRKNHLAILHSAEILWREGHEFSLSFIGGSGWGEDFPRRIEELVVAGRPVHVHRAVSESELDKAYDSADFTVFPSLHEGYGLPVAESLGHGTPVITSNFGSTAEIGRAGGTLMIDPRDNHALTAAMRILLAQPEVLARLRKEIALRPVRRWQTYADELWRFLVEPELASLKGESNHATEGDR